MKLNDFCPNDAFVWLPNQSATSCLTYRVARFVFLKHGHKIYQMAVNYVLQMAMQYTNILNSKALQNIVKLDFWLYNQIYNLATLV
jgi:hypothetical protein